MKNVVSLLSLSVALALGATSVACSGQANENTQPQTSASALSKAPIGAGTHGVVKLVGEALGEVPLRPDQRTELEKMAADAEKRHVGLADGRKDLMLAIADQVEKGTIDRAALQPKIDRVVADFDKARPDDHAALTRMHALLDADQRNTFVDAMEQKLKAQKAEHKEGFAAMKQLADDLKLTDDQRSKLKEMMHQGIKEHFAGHDRRDATNTPNSDQPAEEGQSWRERAKEMHHAGKKSLESFRAEQFDVNAMTPPDVKDRVAKGTGHAVSMAEKVLPILTPEQRKLAADKIRGMAEKGEMGPFGH